MHGAAHDRQRPDGRAGLLCDPTASVALGDLLRGARERRGLSLDQIKRETKIPTRHLAAIEHGELDALPGAFYTRGEVAAFATAVGLDRREALERLERALHPPPAIAIPIRPDARPRAGNHLRVFAMIALGALTAVVAAWAARELTARREQQEVVVAPSAVHESPSTDIAPAHQATPATSSPQTAALSVPVVVNDARKAAHNATRDEPSALAAPTVSTAPTLTIVTNPPGARVTVDGIGWGATPITIRNVAAGARQIRVTLAGYSGAEQMVHIPDTGSAHVIIPLQRR